MSKIYVDEIAGIASPSTVAIPGHVIQVVTAESTGNAITTQSETYVDTGISISITPTSANSTIVLTFNFTSTSNQTDTQGGTAYQIFRDDTVELYTGSNSVKGVLSYFSTNGYIHSPSTLTAFDSPSTTSSTEYSLYMRIIVASRTGALQRDWGGVQMTAMEIAG